MKIIILAGGVGSRLWPLSRTYYPKQFLKLKGMKLSMFQLTVQRALLLGSINDIYVVTNKDYKFLVSGQINEMGYIPNPENILLEPQAKNTLPAIFYAVRKMQREGEHLVAVFPSDHLIKGEKEFISVVEQSKKLAGDYIVTFGIRPSLPETGYGYIQPGEAIGNGFIVDKFREKPDLKKAEEYVANGYLWNSGMFMFSTDIFSAEVKRFAPDVYSAFEDIGNMERCYNDTPSISIDYGVMEKSDKVAVVPFQIHWNDMGGFMAFYDNYDEMKDAEGNITFGSEVLLNAHNNVVYADTQKAVGLVGVDDMVVIDQKDALLICKKDEAYRVKEIVDRLKAVKDPRADYHVTDYRPWGSFTVLEEGTFYKIKRLTVLPGEKLSYQLHYHRSEHWIVVHGTANVVVNDKDNLIGSGESVYVPMGSKHRLENPGKMMLEVIEVQIGVYLNEDDIIRFEDVYERS
jgi:mannose-1-phosphate guanylyltransferase/mannose-6-phosphate isomerase